MTRRAGLGRLAAWCTAAGLGAWPRPGRAGQRQVEVLLSLVHADGRPVADEALRLVLGTSTDWRAPNAGQALRTDAQGRVRWTTALPRETRHKRWTSNYVDTVLSLPERVDWLQVAVELPFMGAPCLYSAELDWFASHRTSVQSATAAHWADETGRFTRGAEAVDAGRSWRLPLPAYRGWLFTGLGHELVHGSLMPIGDQPPDNGAAADVRWRVELQYRRHPPPVAR